MPQLAAVAAQTVTDYLIFPMYGRNADGCAILDGAPLDGLLEGAGVETPAYVYDLDAIRDAARSLHSAFGSASHLVAYAVKANSAGPVLRTLAAEGCGADVVSGAELALALEVGVAPDDIVFSGVAKKDAEIDLAIRAGQRGVAAIQIESLEEIDRVAARARRAGTKTRISLRVNPGIEVDTHAHIATGHDRAKFGIAREDLPRAFDKVDGHGELTLVGLSCHVGAQQTSTGSYLEAAELMFAIAREREAKRGPLTFLDAGGGFGIDYGSGCPVSPADFARGLVAIAARAKASHLRLVVEPGRSLVGSHGFLVASVIQVKHSPAKGRSWLMIDAGMNDLIRPALYQARHRIEPLRVANDAKTTEYRVVGPICESSDDFGSYELPAEAPRAVVIRDAGAYGFTMASQYNGRPLPPEVFVSGGRVTSVSAGGTAEAWIRGRLSATR